MKELSQNIFQCLITLIDFKLFDEIDYCLEILFGEFKLYNKPRDQLYKTSINNRLIFLLFDGKLKFR